MTTQSEHLAIERVLAVLRRRWWVVAGLTILVTAITFGLSVHERKQYTATTSLLFEDPQLSQQASGVQVIQTSPTEDPRIMATNIQLLTQQAGVAAATAHIVGHRLSSSAVSNAISVSEEGQTNVADVSATNPSPVVAADIATTYVNQFIASRLAQQQASIAQAQDLVERQIAALSREQLSGTTGQGLLDRAESLRILAKLQDGGAQVVRPATPPSSPSAPKTTRNLIVGAVLGLVLGLSLAFLLDRLDRRMKNVEDLETAYQLPLLAAVPHKKSYATPPQAGSAPDRGDSEVFKLLRAYLRYFNVDRELRVLLVASAAPGDGKTTVARNLAEAAQETGTRTLLLEADLRRPSIAQYYQVKSAPGLSDLLIGTVPAHETIQAIPVATRVNGATSEVSLDVIVAGHPPPNPAELIESRAMADVLSWATERYELVLIDTPPLAVVSDAIPLLRKVDGVVLVSHVGKNTRDAAAVLRERLLGVKAPLLGVVANGVKARADKEYGYGYGYGSNHNQHVRVAGSAPSPVNGHDAVDVAEAEDAAHAPGKNHAHLAN